MAKKHYVNNRDFYDAIVAYREVLKEKPESRIPDYIGVCIFNICDRLSTKPNFIGYSFRDEMVSDGIENCVRAVPLFDPEKTKNPFAYFTQIAWNSFIRRISIEKREQYLKHKSFQHMHLSGELDELNHGESAGTSQIKDNAVSNEIINSFESRLTKPKKRDIVSGVEKFIEA